MGKTRAKEVKAQEKRAGSTKRETELEVKQEARNGETEAKRVTHESQAKRSGGLLLFARTPPSVWH